MIKSFKQIPEPLQKQILYRLAYGAAILFVTIVLFFYTLDWISVLACVIAIIACIISAFSLFRRAVIGDYVEIRGEFLKVILNAVKRRPKAIILCTEDNQKLKVMIKQKLKKINTGSKITVYVATNTPVYEDNGMQLLYSYLVLDIKKEKEKGE